MRPMTLMTLLVPCLLALGAPAAAQDSVTERPGSAAGLEDRVWSHVRITTADGWRLDDVDLAWFANGGYVRVTWRDGSRHDYKAADIVKVEAADGTDLTAEVADARPAVAGRRTSNVGTSHVTAPVPSGRRTFAVAVTGGLSYGSYAGDWFEGFKDDFGLQGTLRLGGDKGKGWFSLSYCRQGGGHYDLYDNSRIDLHVDEYLVMYGLPTRRLVHARRVPYAELGVAVMRFAMNAYTTSFGSRSASLTKGGPVVRLGVLMGIGNHGVADLGLDILHKPAFLTEGPGGTIFGVHVGIGYVAW